MKTNAKEKKTHESGYISFSPDDLKNAAEQDPANYRAYEYLDQAMTTSSHVSAKSKESGEVIVDDVYPISMEETLEMEQLLDKAEQAAGNPDEAFFSERLNELRDIVDFSKKRHWNFSWLVIVGVLVMVGYLWVQMDNAKRSAANDKIIVELVKNWTEKDTTIVLSAANTQVAYNEKYANANNFKASELYRLAQNYNSYVNGEKKYLAQADTASTAERKELFKKYAQQDKEKAEKNLKRYNELNAMKFAQVHEKALKQVTQYSDNSASDSRSTTLWCIFFIVLIPLYIFAERPYGYTMSRYRNEADIKGGIMKWTYAISAGLASAAAAISFIDTITTYSDGHKERSTDAGTNAPVIAMKILLLAAAVAILCLVSCVIMIWSTATGLARNYDWKAIYNKVRLAVAKKQ